MRTSKRSSSPTGVFTLLVFIAKALAQEPEFSEPIPNVTVAVGRDASLPCVVEHLGTYKVAWVHIDREMVLTIHHHVITRDHRISVSHNNHKNWLLHIRNVQEQDSGYYMCQINTTPMKSQVGYLEVVVPPDIMDQESSSSTVRVREGTNVSLTCKASGYPEPSISWRREDNKPIGLGRKQVPSWEGEVLNVTKVSRVHMGAYLCIASNGVPPSVSKRIMLDVEFSPMIWIPNQLVGAPSGTDVLLECHTEAFPKSINYWARDSGMLMTNTKYETLEVDSLYTIHMKLKIKRLHAKDFGTYKCVAKNNLGETEGSIGLYELHPPTRPSHLPDDRIGHRLEEFTEFGSIRNGSAARSKNLDFRQNALLEDAGHAEKEMKYQDGKGMSGGSHDGSSGSPPRRKPPLDAGCSSSVQPVAIVLLVTIALVTLCSPLIWP